MSESHRKASLPILFSVIIIDLIGFGIVLPILPFYATEYGASPPMLGLILTSYAAAQFICAPLWGRLSDRIGRRPVMLMTIAGTSASLFALASADSIAWLLLARLLAGGFGANITVATAYLTDITEEHERTRWMGMVGASFGIGFVLGPAVGGLLSPYGHDLPMYVAAAMAAANGLLAALVLREPEGHVTPEERGV
jgi:DHA1 family tetracycline resistance protein-like MFS transporter